MTRLTVIVRAVSKAIEKCELTTIERKPISYERVDEQHNAYVNVFEKLIADGHDIKLIKLPALDQHADSMFVEDVALIFPQNAVLTRPGVASRQPEVDYMAETISQVRPNHTRIVEPGCIDGGDVLMIGKYAFAGKSTRTNDEGFAQLKDYVATFGIEAVRCEITGCMHLKCAATALSHDTVLVNSALIDKAHFTSRGLNVIEADPQEHDAANILTFVSEKDGVPIRTYVYNPTFPNTLERVRAFADKLTETQGIKTQIFIVDGDEIAKAEGALTCCSQLCYN